MSTDDAAVAAAETPAPPPLLLRVVRGEPTAEDIAALVAVFASMGGAAGEDNAPPEEWSQPARLHRTPIFPGDSRTWWASGLPR